MRRQWLLFGSALVLVFSVLPFIMGAKVLTYGLLTDPYVPFGNLLVATGILSLLVFGHVASDVLYYPIYELQYRLSMVSKILIVCALLWWPVGYLLADNFAANFGTGEGFRGSVLAGQIYRFYTYGIIILASLLWLASVVIYMTNKKIEVHEIIDVLRNVISGKAEFMFSAGYYWAGRMTTTVQIDTQGYEILFFVDAGELDYVEWAKAPDGREGDYDYWDSREKFDCQGPLDLMPEEEHDQLLERFVELDEELMAEAKRKEISVFSNYPHCEEFSEESFTSVLHEKDIWDKDKYWALEKAIIDFIPEKKGTIMMRDNVVPVIYITSYIMSVIRAHFDQNDGWTMPGMTDSEMFEYFERLRILQLWFVEGEAGDLNSVSDEVINPLL